MITARNEFETIPAFTTIAGSSHGQQSQRETTLELIDNLSLTSQYNCESLYRELAEMTDNDENMFDLQDEVAQYIYDNAPLPEFCSVTLQDNEYIVLPCLESAEEECKKVADIPDDNQGDFILYVNDHGNVTCLQWNEGCRAYDVIWDMV